MEPGSLYKLHHIYSPYLDRLSKIYAAMDQKYALAAEYYCFHCTGCDDNCCFTRFYHHTCLEFLFVFKGYHGLDKEQKDKIKTRALRVCNEAQAADEKALAVRQMCPLNFEGKCILYAFRPMICRLHGIAHEFHRPDQKIIYGPGCQVFTRRCREKKYFKFDRTPFYLEMAALEKELKQALGYTGKIRITVAEMVAKF